MFNSLKSFRVPFAVCLVLFSVIACATVEIYKEPPRVYSAKQTYNYHNDIKPILDKKCIACHACYDAPCQLKLEGPEGVERGASKNTVYNAARLVDENPTRLHIDALTTSEWRRKGFFSVIAPQDSLMLKMLELGRENPVTPDAPLGKAYSIGINRDNECPNPDEFSDYKKDNPNGGMPYAITGLTESEYQAVTTWLKQGAKIESKTYQLPSNITQQVQKWERYFNGNSLREQLVARYLYEHLFLAHLYFEGDKGRHFFKVVRSKTAAPQKIIPITTAKPYGDPKGDFYYRLMPITDTIVHKTHIVYPLSSERMARFTQLFFETKWDVEKLPGYSYEFASNPFLTFKAIPAKSRYQFMLDDAEYFTRTFIRGPVCRGQIATDVIRDQFWIMFEDPEIDQYVNDFRYQQKAIKYLGLPGEETDLFALGSAWLKYSGKRNKYIDRRQKQYKRAFPKGASIDHVWDGDGHNDNAFLTVFRHHNSATVVKGWRGANPLTLWMLDYPLFERTYYELVVGFNVFGSVSHQAQTRLYFDLIRNGGETNFLRLMTPDNREAVYDKWYSYSGLIKTFMTYHEMDVKTPSAVTYQKGMTEKDQVIQQVSNRHRKLLPTDMLNRCDKNCQLSLKNEANNELTLALSSLSEGAAADIPGILQLPEVTFLRVDFPDGSYEVYTIFRNRAHSNVAFMHGEALRYQPEKDTVTILKGPVSSYPNFIFSVEASDVPDFVMKLRAMKDEKDRIQLVAQYGVRRSNPEFWAVFHSFREYLERTDPLQAGYYDLNRYKGW